MTVSLSHVGRFLTLAVLASAVAVGCSKKVKETPPAETPVDTGATTTPVTSTTPGAYTPADLADSWAREATASGEMAEGVAAFQARRAPDFPWRGRA